MKTRDDSDESKNIVQQSAAERRKAKRETLANYLKTSEKPLMSQHTHKKHQISLTGRNSGTLIHNKGEEGMQRQSSKTSMHSHSSTA